LDLLPLIESETERKSLELDYYLTLGGCYVVTHGFPHPKVKETFDKARMIARDTEVSPKLAIILWNLYSYYGNIEDYTSFDEIREDLEALSEDPTHGYWFKLIKHGIGMNLVRGYLTQTEKGYATALEIFNPELPFPWELTPGGNAKVAIESWRMIGLSALGNFKLGNQLVENHKIYQSQHKDSVTLYHIHTFPALFKLEMREYATAAKLIEDYFPIVREFGDPVFNLTAEVYYNIAKALLGEKGAIETSRNLLETCFQIGFKAFASCLTPYLSEIYLKNSDYESSLDWTGRMIDRVNSSGSRYKLAELYRLKALALQALESDKAEIESCFKKALEISREISAKTFELRAARDYAQFMNKQGKSDEARRLLSEVYNWFDADAESVDLDEAKKVLEEL
jgi:adenylate cyclase